MYQYSRQENGDLGDNRSQHPAFPKVDLRFTPSRLNTNNASEGILLFLAILAGKKNPVGPTTDRPAGGRIRGMQQAPCFYGGGERH